MREIYLNTMLFKFILIVYHECFTKAADSSFIYLIDSSCFINHFIKGALQQICTSSATIVCEYSVVISLYRKCKK